jgi:hypothetical protein
MNTCVNNFADGIECLGHISESMDVWRGERCWEPSVSPWRGSEISAEPARPPSRTSTPTSALPSAPDSCPAINRHNGCMAFKTPKEGSELHPKGRPLEEAAFRFPTLRTTRDTSARLLTYRFCRCTACAATGITALPGLARPPAPTAKVRPKRADPGADAAGEDHDG